MTSTKLPEEEQLLAIFRSASKLKQSDIAVVRYFAERLEAETSVVCDQVMIHTPVPGRS